MSLLIVTTDRILEHRTPPGHPERAERGEVMLAAASAWRKKGGHVEEPRPATDEELRRVHKPEYLDKIDLTAGRSAALDPDTYTSPATRDVALLAAGAAVGGIEAILKSRTSRVFALMRPPGHHAEADRAMGFCFYNSIAVGAAHALSLGVDRIAIVDYDVHHGNGTQWMFYDDPRVLYVSTHQYPFYPGTGPATDVGEARGAGFTLNVPLEAGATDGDYREVFASLVEPIIDQFAPQLVMVSAGFDAHERDPLARMRLSAEGYAHLTESLAKLSDRHCQGRLMAITEGGYDLDALRACLDSTISTLAGSPAPGLPSNALGPTMRSKSAIAAVRAAHAKYWKL